MKNYSKLKGIASLTAITLVLTPTLGSLQTGVIDSRRYIDIAVDLIYRQVNSAGPAPATFTLYPTPPNVSIISNNCQQPSSDSILIYANQPCTIVYRALQGADLAWTPTFYLYDSRFAAFSLGYSIHELFRMAGADIR